MPLIALAACSNSDVADEAAGSQIEQLDAPAAPAPPTEAMAPDPATEADEAQLETAVDDLEVDAERTDGAETEDVPRGE